MQKAYTEIFQKAPEMFKFCTPVSSASFGSKVVSFPNKKGKKWRWTTRRNLLLIDVAFITS
jgi:hypothetical protein